MLMPSLYKWMVIVNAISFALLFGLTSLLDIKFDDTRGYTESIKPFAPECILNLAFYEPIPVQYYEIGKWRIYLPGLAIDCALGAFQGLILGLNLLTPTKNSKTRNPSLLLPAINMFLYAGMCCSALLVHCIRDGGPFDEWPPSVLKFFVWMDIYCTTCVPAIMLLDTLSERRLFGVQQTSIILICIFVFKALAVVVAVELESRWAGFVLHVLSMILYGCPIFSLAIIDAIPEEQNRRKDESTTCLHSFPWLVSATACLIFLAGPSALFAVPLSKITNRAFDAHSGIFWGCRCGMLQYYSYVKRRASCRHCNKPLKIT